jgi:hypothetical protein
MEDRDEQVRISALKKEKWGRKAKQRYRERLITLRWCPVSSTVDGAFCEDQVFAGWSGIVPAIAARDPQICPSHAHPFSCSSRILAFLYQKLGG